MPRRAKSNRIGWSEQLDRLMSDIDTMAIGPERDAALRRAKQLEAAIHMDGWLRSGERPPTTEHP